MKKTNFAKKKLWFQWNWIKRFANFRGKLMGTPLKKQKLHLFKTFTLKQRILAYLKYLYLVIALKVNHFYKLLIKNNQFLPHNYNELVRLGYANCFQKKTKKRGVANFKNWSLFFAFLQKIKLFFFVKVFFFCKKIWENKFFFFIFLNFLSFIQILLLSGSYMLEAVGGGELEPQNTLVTTDPEELVLEESEEKISSDGYNSSDSSDSSDSLYSKELLDEKKNLGLSNSEELRRRWLKPWRVNPTSIPKALPYRLKVLFFWKKKYSKGLGSQEVLSQLKVNFKFVKEDFWIKTNRKYYGVDEEKRFFFTDKELSYLRWGTPFPWKWRSVLWKNELFILKEWTSWGFSYPSVWKHIFWKRKEIVNQVLEHSNTSLAKKLAHSFKAKGFELYKKGKGKKN